MQHFLQLQECIHWLRYYDLKFDCLTTKAHYCCVRHTYSLVALTSGLSNIHVLIRTMYEDNVTIR